MGPIKIISLLEGILYIRHHTRRTNCTKSTNVHRQGPDWREKLTYFKSKYTLDNNFNINLLPSFLHQKKPEGYEPHSPFPWSSSSILPVWYPLLWGGECLPPTSLVIY